MTTATMLLGSRGCAALFLVGAVLLSGCRGHGRDVEGLRANLRSENPVVRNEAIVKLGQFEDRRAAADIATFLSRDHSSVTRTAAARAIGNLGATNGMDHLILALGDRDKDLRLTAIEALGKLRLPGAVEPLIAALDSGEERLPACWALGRIGDRRAIAPLMALTASDDPYVSYAARQALKRIDGGH